MYCGVEEGPRTRASNEPLIAHGQSCLFRQYAVQMQFDRLQTDYYVAFD